MGEHARLSPSGASIWLNCPGSVAAQADEPDDANVWSAEGTVAHRIFEKCLKFGLEAYDFIGQTLSADGFEFEIKDDMADHLQPIIDDIRDFGGDQYYEKRIKLDKWMPGQFGTLDVGIIAPKLKKPLISIEDLKYGAGVPVDPEHNAQLMIYGAGFWENIARHVWPHKEKPTFRFVIHQPRNMGGGGTWECSYYELMMFMDEVKRAAAKTYDKHAPRIAGDKQCGYCKAAMNGHCAAYDAFNLKKFGAKFDDVNGEAGKKDVKLPDPDKMDAEMRANILRQAPGLRQWLNRLHADHLNDCLSGRPGGGLKAVAGRKGRRAWKNEDFAEEMLLEEGIAEDSIHVTKVVSPAVAEKLLGKGGRAKINALCDQPDGKPVLVPESDERPAIEAYHERFDEFSDENE